MSAKSGPNDLGLTDEQIMALASKGPEIAQAAAEIAARKAAASRGAAALAGRVRSYQHSRRPMGVAWFDDLSDEDQMRVIAEHNLKAYGSIVPPPEARLAVLTKECPVCHIIKPVLKGFGIRVIKGTPRSQSTCTRCRTEANAAARAKARHG